MKNTRRRSIIISIITCLFISGLIFFCFKLVTNSNQWALKPTNPHITNIGLSNSGAIYDRNDVHLASSKDGKRSYNENLSTRKAVMHIVGDNTTFISTAIQNVYRAELFGYSFVLGLNAPEFAKKKNDIKLTIDSALCKTAMNELGDRKGAVCIYNYKTGEIVCMASTPTYDPQSPPDFKSDTSNKYEGAYLNRTISASYSPGSIFKIITGACGIDNINNVDKTSFVCNQKEKVDGQDITCMGYHGDITFKNAMAKSCNIYFANLAIKLGKTKMIKTASDLGFNKNFQMNKIKIQSSHYDVSKENDLGLGWSGVGQQEVLANPMHMMIVMGAIANGGVPVIPNLIQNISSEIGENKTSTSIEDRMLSTNTANTLKETMRYTVKNNPSYSAFSILNVCAKTGTAEVGKGKAPHGWVVGFCMDEKKPYAFSVIVENGGYGSKCAVPIVANLLKQLN